MLCWQIGVSRLASLSSSILYVAFSVFLTIDVSNNVIGSKVFTTVKKVFSPINYFVDLCKLRLKLIRCSNGGVWVVFHFSFEWTSFFTTGNFSLELGQLLFSSAALGGEFTKPSDSFASEF